MNPVLTGPKNNGIIEPLKEVQFMKERRVWTPEEKFNLVIEVLQGHKTVSETCRDNQLSANQFYKWKDAFLRSALEGLKNKRLKTNKDPLVEENRKLLKLVGRYALMVSEQKKFFSNSDEEI